MGWEEINGNKFAHRCEINGWNVTRYKVLGKFKSDPAYFEYTATKDGERKITTKDFKKLKAKIDPAAQLELF